MLIGKILLIYIAVSFLLLMLGLAISLVKTFILHLYYKHCVFISRIKGEEPPRSRVDVLGDLDIAASLVVRLCIMPFTLLPKSVGWIYITYVRYKYKSLILTNPDPEIRKILKKDDN